jgi:hypothetical protein
MSKIMHGIMQVQPMFVEVHQVTGEFLVKPLVNVQFGIGSTTVKLVR